MSTTTATVNITTSFRDLFAESGIFANILSFYELNIHTFPVVLRSILGRTGDAWIDERIREVISLYGYNLRRRMGLHPNFSYCVPYKHVAIIGDVCDEVTGSNDLDRYPNSENRVVRLEIKRDHDVKIRYQLSDEEYFTVPKVDITKFPNLRELCVRHWIPEYAKTTARTLEFVDYTANEHPRLGDIPETVKEFVCTVGIFEQMMASNLVPASLERLLVHKTSSGSKSLIGPGMTKFGIKRTELIAQSGDVVKNYSIINDDTTYATLVDPARAADFANLYEYCVKKGDITITVARLNLIGTFVPLIDNDSVDFRACTSTSINRIIIEYPAGDDKDSKGLREIVLPDSCLSLRDMRLPKCQDLIVPTRVDENGVAFPSLRLCRIDGPCIYNAVISSGAPCINKLKLTWREDTPLYIKSRYISRLKLMRVSNDVLEVECPRLRYIWVNMMYYDRNKYLEKVKGFIPAANPSDLVIMNHEYTLLIWRNHWADMEGYKPDVDIKLSNIHKTTNLVVNRISDKDEYERLKAKHNIA